MDAFYERLDTDRFASTGHTTGPWGNDSQHLGPPSALLVRALERCAPRPEAVLSRVAFEVLGPVPVAELTVTASVARPGSRAPRPAWVRMAPDATAARSARHPGAPTASM